MLERPLLVVLGHCMLAGEADLGPAALGNSAPPQPGQRSGFSRPLQEPEGLSTAHDLRGTAQVKPSRGAR